ncbi:hypothetical protein [Streptomyces tremellae]|uniref:TetR family transcriptional regulator n=1 Tax=Streptomyces tremellae TaxID=1124239 RepID=A0ABP7FBC3_9ACTN
MWTTPRRNSPSRIPLAEITSHLDALVRFLAHSPAGAGCRALLAAAQRDPAVRRLLATKDVLGAGASAGLRRIDPTRPGRVGDHAINPLIGPAFFWIVSGRDPAQLATHEPARGFLRDLGSEEP